MMGRQFSQKLHAWKEELLRQLYTPVAQVPFEGFTTLDRLTRTEAAAHEKRPFAPGEKWGACWEYGWFSGTVCIPEACRGKRVVLMTRMGGETLVYQDGRAIGAVDRGHPYVTLTRCAQGGERYAIGAECYAGHGARLENLGPCPPERRAIPEPPAAQCVYEDSVLAVWNEEAYQLALDVVTLDWLLQALPEKSLRAQKVRKALNDFVNIADFELPPRERTESFVRARAALALAMACHNGSTMPTMWVFGQSHIDLAWLWTTEETRRKAVRTYANQLTLMDEYPEYRFLLCEPALLDMLREQDGDCWQRVRQAAQRGQIFAEGAFYVECDTNIPSGESLIRQLLWGKRWYREQFGVDSQVAWQPDTFGFSAALPQILRKMGVPYFASQKLTRVDPECQPFPYQHFYWEGIDGSEVLALNFKRNNSPIDPLALHKRWEEDRAQQEDIDTLLFPFGYGDGGGGPTRDMLELARRVTDLEGVPRAQYGGLREYFAFIESQGVKNRWVGELYLTWHRGTYTAQRRQKMQMRRLEEALRTGEYLLSLLPGASLRQAVDQGWDALLFSQFHDLAGGVGIRRVHEEASAALGNALEALQAACNAAVCKLFALTPSAEALTLFNPLSWNRTEWARLPDGSFRYVSVPAYGAAPLGALPQPDDARLTETENGIRMENRYLALEVDGSGRIVSLIDRENGVPLLSPGMVMNDWRLYKNVQAVYDAWELDRDWREGYLPDAMTVSIEVGSRGGAYCALRIRRSFGESTAEQEMRLYAASRRIDFETHVDWHERHKMLKAHFESNVICENALHEIQFGAIERPAHASHPFAWDRYESCNHRYSALCEENRGFALLNNGIYGVSTGRGELALTLLRAPLVPDDTADQGEHTFTYALYPFAAGFAASDAVREGYALNQPLAPLHGAGAESAGIACDSASVVLETVKPAEDGEGMILRLYESKHTWGTATIHFPFTVRAWESAMDEMHRGALLAEGREMSVQLRPFEIKTLRAERMDAETQE